MFLSGDSEIAGAVAVGDTLSVAGTVSVGTDIAINGTSGGNINVDNKLVVNGTDNRYEVWTTGLRGVKISFRIFGKCAIY